MNFIFSKKIFLWSILFIALSASAFAVPLGGLWFPDYPEVEPPTDTDGYYITPIKAGMASTDGRGTVTMLYRPKKYGRSRLQPKPKKSTTKTTKSKSVKTNSGNNRGYYKPINNKKDLHDYFTHMINTPRSQDNRSGKVKNSARTTSHQSGSGKQRSISTKSRTKKSTDRNKKSLTEAEFRKKIGLKQPTTKEKIIEYAVKGLTAVGTLGLLYFALTPTKAAATAVATGAATSASGTATTGAAIEAGGGVTDAISEGIVEPEITEADVKLPKPPKVGETRSYTDKNGTRWTEVYNGQNWVDKGSYNAAQDQIADNQKWAEEQRIKQQTHDTAFDRMLEDNARAHEAELQEIHTRNRNAIKENLKIVQETDEMLQAMSERSLQRIERVNDLIDTGKTVVDVTLPVIGAAAGPPGWVVGTGYTLLSETGQGVATGVVDSNKSVLVEGAKGAAKGIVNVIVGEGINSTLAVGSKILKSGATAIQKGGGFKAAFKSTAFNSPIPKEGLGQMYNNFKNGFQLTSGVDANLANKSITGIGKILAGKGGAVPRLQGSELAKEAVSSFTDGAISSARGQLVDSQISKAANEGIWGKS